MAQDAMTSSVLKRRPRKRLLIQMASNYFYDSRFVGGHSEKSLRASETHFMGLESRGAMRGWDSQLEVELSMDNQSQMVSDGLLVSPVF